MSITLGKTMALSQIIEAMKKQDDRNDLFCLYAPVDSGQLEDDAEYYVDDYPDVVNDQSVYPEFVRNNKLHLIYYGQQFADVIDNALDQKPNASVKELVSALNYYMKNDDFLDF